MEFIASTSKTEEEFGVWQENEEVLMMFLRLQTQWDTVMGGVIGIKYSSIDFLFRVHQPADPKSMLDDLQAMERAALEILNRPKD